MRIVTYGGAVTLDGFLAGPRGEIDWLHFSNDVQKVMTDYGKNVDTILMGRKTYTPAAGQGHSAGKNRKRAKRQTRKKPTRLTYVFSRILKSIDEPGVELVAGDAAEFVRDLKQRPGKGICLMGGANWRSRFSPRAWWTKSA